MDVEIIILGGAEEIGANSCYINAGGTGIIIDAGLHPRRRDRMALPQIERLNDKAVHTFILTHAHTDHLGGLPYVLKAQPHLRMIATRPTRDLVGIMLQSTIKLLQLDNPGELPPDALSLYDRALLDKFALVFEGFPYNEPITLASDEWQGAYHQNGAGKVREALTLTLHDAGHIIGSAGVMIQGGGAAILHSGDVQFARQTLLPGASLPRHHLDVLIMETTNGADEHPRSHHEEQQRLAAFINQISSQNGSVLLPVFALGKTQETLKILYNLIRQGAIPDLPIYSGGMSRRISKVYDRYCYTVPRVEPGFEVADIPCRSIIYDELLSGRYFHEPSFVVLSSGMVNVGSPSYTLAERWMSFPHFGIGLMGYQDPSTPGYQLLHSERNKPFVMANKKVTRKCHLEKFRFSAHSNREDILSYIFDVRPKHLFLVHGDTDATESVGLAVKENLPQTKVYIPVLGKSYHVTL